MNEKDRLYSVEYVEIKTSLEHIRTKLESIEHAAQHTHHTLEEFHKQMDKNRSDIAGIKAVSAVIGGLTGSLVAILSRIVFVS